MRSHGGGRPDQLAWREAWCHWRCRTTRAATHWTRCESDWPSWWRRRTPSSCALESEPTLGKLNAWRPGGRWVLRIERLLGDWRATSASTSSTGHAGFWTVVRFGWHRFLRIMPGFWVCLLVLALVVAPLAAVLEGRPAGHPVRDRAFVVGFHRQQRSSCSSGKYGHRRPAGWKPASRRSLTALLWTLVLEADVLRVAGGARLVRCCCVGDRWVVLLLTVVCCGHY